jgi:hypothetical protein
LYKAVDAALPGNTDHHAAGQISEIGTNTKSMVAKAPTEPLQD